MSIIDPQSFQIDGVAGEAAVDLARLNLTWIRQRFELPPKWQPEISGEHSDFPSDKQFTDASVLLALVERNDGLTLLFTRRTEHLAQHPGQISFPGGRVDVDDKSLIDTALREAHEEIGLIRDQMDVLGTLPDYYTVSGYKVTPVVAAVKAKFELQSNAHEVAEIFEVPLAHLMDGRLHERRSGLLPDQIIRRHFYAIPYQNYFIWGATAGILRNLFHFLRA